MYDFLIVGAGIFGVTTAVELRKRSYSVALLNPDTIPHHLAASTDISKAVRMEYGTDREYADMAEYCIEGWKAWNELFGETLYHEVGFLMLCKESLEHDRSAFERGSYQTLLAKGYRPERLDRQLLYERFPVVHADQYTEAVFNPDGGYAESGHAVDLLTRYAVQLGVDLLSGQTAEALTVEREQIVGVSTREGRHFACGHLILTAGAGTPYLLPELQPNMRITGHPVFHVLPSRPDLIIPDRLPVFMADISHSGWYGFPVHPKQGVFKVAKHTAGLELHPERDNRIITDVEIQECRQFLREHFPVLGEDPIIYTRRCLYTDTLDGHFWIDRHPEIGGLTVASGGSGHGFKMGPILGEIIADTAEGKANLYSSRFRWRELDANTVNQEEARAKT